MRRYPELAGQYHIACVDHETGYLKVNFAKQVGRKRIEGGKVVTEFVDADQIVRAEAACCEWTMLVPGTASQGPTELRAECTAYWV